MSRRASVSPGVAAVAGALLAAGLLAALPAAAQTQRWIAFGDSITQGVGDDQSRPEPGYPARLEAILAGRGVNADVVNAGLGGETTGDALSRVGSVLNQGGTRFLLMEGTNDINEKVSVETITFNLDQLADRAEARGMQVHLATLVPRLPTANTDGSNVITAELAGAIRELAANTNRQLIDPFEVFFHQTPNFAQTHYVGGIDRLHPNATGYTLLAQVFADALTNIDRVPPVIGDFSPANGAVDVSATAQIRLDLYDFGTGIDSANTRLLVNGQEVTATLTPEGRRLGLLYQPATPLRGLVSVTYRSRDLANPANTVERLLTEFTILGAVFLDGDVNRDGRVDGTDLITLAIRFGARRGDTRYLTNADVNRDGTIDGLDLAQLATNFGRTS